MPRKVSYSYSKYLCCALSLRHLLFLPQVIPLYMNQIRHWPGDQGRTTVDCYGPLLFSTPLRYQPRAYGQIRRTPCRIIPISIYCEKPRDLLSSTKLLETQPAPACTSPRREYSIYIPKGATNLAALRLDMNIPPLTQRNALRRIRICIPLRTVGETRLHMLRREEH
jgi:hypothetical protein